MDYWKALTKILERHYPCHLDKAKAYQAQGDECRQKLEENDPRCCVATFVDDHAGRPAIQLAFGFQGKLQMFQAGKATIKAVSKEAKPTLFADHMAANLQSYQAIIADKIASVDKLVARNAQLEKQVHALLKQKEETEKSLYAKFLCVLNEKKRKIRELQDEAESGRTTAVSPAVAGKFCPFTCSYRDLYSAHSLTALHKIRWLPGRFPSTRVRWLRQ
jgi:hypothetical protein